MLNGCCSDSNKKAEGATTEGVRSLYYAHFVLLHDESSGSTIICWALRPRRGPLRNILDFDGSDNGTRDKATCILVHQSNRPIAPLTPDLSPELAETNYLNEDC
jgi:hypothetical protein